MIVAHGASSASATDMKPFVFQKAKSYSQNFSKNELTELATKMITLYHESRRGKSEMASALEQFVLSV